MKHRRKAMLALVATIQRERHDPDARRPRRFMPRARLAPLTTTGALAVNIGIVVGLQSAVPAQAAATVPKVTSVAGGDLQSGAVRSDGTAWFWGQDVVGAETGLNEPPATSNGGIPVHIPGTYNAKQIDVTGSSPVTLNNDGTVWIWDGKLSDSPTQKAGLGSITQSHERSPS